MNTGSEQRGQAPEPTDPDAGKPSGDDREGRADAPDGDRIDIDGKPTEEEPEHISKAPAFIKARRGLHLSWQVGVFVVGLAVIGAGVAMLVLPGPGWFVIFAGLAIWATEFVWARLALRWTKRKVTEAAQRALDPKVRRRNIILTATGLVIAGVLITVYLVKYGFVLPWSLDEG
ncbi:TIGR02611 family protein [Streptomyces sp. BI20]|uniref:TIGR02611 family protein n=1 Tax=Streptomyces sp. BI20 TaxID=3403460 RepID=UPI003C77762A